MQVQLPPFIRSISGKVGNLVYKTRYDADGRPHVRAYPLPAKRSTPPTPRENAQRTRFGTIARAVQIRRKAGDRRTYKQIWAEVAADYDARNPDAHHSSRD